MRKYTHLLLLSKIYLNVILCKFLLLKKNSLYGVTFVQFFLVVFVSFRLILPSQEPQRLIDHWLDFDWAKGQILITFSTIP